MTLLVSKFCVKKAIAKSQNPLILVSHALPSCFLASYILKAKLLNTLRPCVRKRPSLLRTPRQPRQPKKTGTKGEFQNQWPLKVSQKNLCGSKKYSKSLSRVEKLNILFTIMGGKIKIVCSGFGIFFWAASNFLTKSYL